MCSAFQAQSRGNRRTGSHRKTGYTAPPRKQQEISEAFCTQLTGRGNVSVAVQDLQAGIAQCTVKVRNHIKDTVVRGGIHTTVHTPNPIYGSERHRGCCPPIDTHIKAQIRAKSPHRGTQVGSSHQPL